MIGVIAARGGSKGIKGKNVIDFCGKPLVAWSIRYGLEYCSEVVVSTNDSKIAEVSEANGARVVQRPEELSGDFATSESAWLHALNEIGVPGDEVVLAMQATSPVRKMDDVRKGIELLSQRDSVFSARSIDDMLLWEEVNSEVRELNFRNDKRTMRQTRSARVIQESGSFYLFKALGLRETGTRLHGKIGACFQDIICTMQIDEMEDLKVLSILYEAAGGAYYGI